MGVPSLSGSGNYVGGDNAVGETVWADLTELSDVLTGNVGAGNIATNGVATAHITNSAVDNTKIKANAVRESHVLFGSSGGVLAARTGPNYVGGGSPRLARVSKTYTTTGAATEEVTVTFASDCADGDPAFTSAPTLLGQPTLQNNEDTADQYDADMIDYCYILEKDNLECTIKVVYLGGGAAAAVSVTMEFGLLGEMTA